MPACGEASQAPPALSSRPAGPLRHEAREMMLPPRPVVTELAGPDLAMHGNALRSQEIGERAVLVRQGVVLAGGDDELRALEAPDGGIVHVGDEGGGTVEV